MDSTLIHWLLVWISLCIHGILTMKREEATRTCGGNHVCRTLMKYKDGTTVDEGENCLCREGESFCNKEWEEGSPSTLTWQHYERAHWSVQYKFCTPVFSGKTLCAANKTTAEIATDVKKWEPHISQPRCVCSDGTIAKSVGWKREDGLWKYFFNCNKGECYSETSPDTSVCAKVYVDAAKSADKVLEMEFLCNCPQDFMCPAQFDEKEDVKHLTRDSKGYHVVKYCESIKSKDH